MNGLYHPAASVVHRMPTLAKLAALAVAVTVIALLREPWQLVAALAVVAALFGLARIPPRVIGRNLRPLAWILLIAAPLNALFSGWESATIMAMRITAAVMLAALFSLTTTVTAILDAITRLLRPFPRVDADRVGLLLALTIRAIPLLGAIVASVFEARKARGTEFSLRAVAVPVIVRALQTSDELGEALIARGLDD